MYPEAGCTMTTIGYRRFANHAWAHTDSPLTHTADYAIISEQLLNCSSHPRREER